MSTSTVCRRKPIQLLVTLVLVPAIYTVFEDGIGRGAIGGYINSYAQQGSLAGQAVARILKGTPPSAIAIPAATSAPTFDARQLGRWRIDETLLPQGSVIKFQQASVLERYRWHIAVAVGALLLQAIVIAGLLIERRRRRSAERETRKRFAEMAHMNRSVALGTLSASIAHEINQPLGAISNNASAAELFMKESPPALADVVEVLADIRRDNQRASDVVARIRTLLRKDAFALRDVDLNRCVSDVVAFLDAEASIRGVLLHPELDHGLPAVSADSVQLQQVVMNLALNGMDAMRDNPPGTRKLIFRTSRADESCAEVSIVDAGTGIPPDRLASIFEPFHTTKPDGMGLGLSISRTIVEAHRGKIAAKNEAGGGAAHGGDERLPDRLDLPLGGEQVLLVVAEAVAVGGEEQLDGSCIAQHARDSATAGSPLADYSLGGRDGTVGPAGLLEAHGAAYCVMSGARLPCVLRVTAPLAYVRLRIAADRIAGAKAVRVFADRQLVHQQRIELALRERDEGSRRRGGTVSAAHGHVPPVGGQNWTLNCAVTVAGAGMCSEM